MDIICGPILDERVPEMVRSGTTPTISTRVVQKYEIPGDTILKKGELIVEKNGISTVMKVGDGVTRYDCLPSIGSHDAEENIFNLQQEAKSNKQMVDLLREQNYDNLNEISRLNKELLELTGRFNRTIRIIHNCRNCGAKLEVPENCGVFHCKYCGTAYALGPVQINSTY